MFCYYLNGNVCKEDIQETDMRKAREIRINGHGINGALLVDDPDVRQTFEDASGQLRHVRSFSQPDRLKSYVRRHPEGIILAGAGTIFFLEPVPVSSAMIRFDKEGSADILVRDGAESIEKQLTAMDAIRTAAGECMLF